MKAESNSPPGAAKASDGLSLLAAAVEHERFAPHCLFTANDFNHDDDENRKRLFYSSGSVLAPAPSNVMDVATAKSNAFSYLNGLLPFPRASLLINGSTMTSLAPHFLPKMVEGEQMIRHSTMKPNETLLKIHINSNQSRSPDSTEFSDSQAIVQPISNSNIDSTIHQISSQGNDKSCSSSNSKQYLRYKLLERQNRLNTSSSSQIAVNEKIVAVGVKSRDERSSKVGAFKSGRFSAFTPCSSTGGGGTLSVKECLSTLSINVGCPGRTNVSPTNSSPPINVIQQQPKSIETPPSVVVASVESQLPSSSSKSSTSPPATNPTSAAVSSSSPGGVSWSSDDQPSSLRVVRQPVSSRRNSSAAALAPTTAADGVQHCPLGKRRRTSEPSLERRRLSSGDECGNGGTAAGASERYVERRRRNNEAAKRCRANRRALFDYRSRQSLELERENLSLRQTVKQLRQELQELRSLLCLRTSKTDRAVGANGETAVVKNSATANANGHYEASVENTSSEDETPLDFSTKKSQIR